MIRATSKLPNSAMPLPTITVAVDDLDGVARVEAALGVDDADRKQAEPLSRRTRPAPSSTTIRPRAGVAQRARA